MAAKPSDSSSRHELYKSGAAVPMVGRVEELAALAGRLEAAGRGEGGVVLIAGEAGAGKTRLLQEFAEVARRAGLLVLWGQAYDTDGMPPYLPFVEAFHGHVSVSSVEDLLPVVQGAPLIAGLIPELRKRFPSLPAAQPLSPEAERFRLFEAVSDFFLQASRSSEAAGLLLCVEDLHWADRSTLQLLVHLARRVRAAPLLIAATYRPEEVDASLPLGGFLADMARERLDQGVTLSPWSLFETAAFVAALSGAAPAPAVVEAIQAETEGNPFFVQELVSELRSEGRDLTRADEAAGEWRVPGGVRSVIGKRLQRLSDDCNRLLEGAAVLGDGFRFETAAAVRGGPAGSLVAALEEAIAAGMLRAEGEAYRFGHSLVRRTIYDSLSLPRRHALHLRAAEALEPSGDEPAESDLAAIGNHWRLGGNPGRATEYLLRAGDAAVTLTAWQEGARYWQAALECMEQTGQPAQRRARLLEGLGDLHFLSSFDAHPSVECYERAVSLYERVGDKAGAARSHAGAGRSLAYPSDGFDYTKALEHLRAAEEVLGAGPDSRMLGEVYLAMAHAQVHSLRASVDGTLDAVHRLRDIAEKLDDDFLRVGANSLEGHCLSLKGHLAQGLALEALACETAAALKDGEVTRRQGSWRDSLLAASSAKEPATDAGSVQLSGSSYGWTYLSNWTMNCCGYQSLELLDPVQALTRHERIRDARGRFLTQFLLFDLYLSDVPTLRQVTEARKVVSGPPVGRAGLSSPFGIGPTVERMLSMSDGRWEEAESGFRQANEYWRNAGSNSVLAWSARWHVRMERVTGAVAAAEAVLEETLHLALSTGAVKYEFPCRTELALLCAETGRLGEAEAHLARCREILADGEDWRGLAGREELAEAAYAAGAGLRDQANAHFERAVAKFREMTLPWDEAEAFEAWARSCRRFHRGQGRRSFVEEKLSCARAIYKRIGAGQPWLDRLEAEERRLAGVPETGAEGTYPDGLTQREVEVLRLIAGGKSNREIAGELVLSIRTVGRHVTNIYAKVGARGKADATAYALRHSLV